MQERWCQNCALNEKEIYWIFKLIFMQRFLQVFSLIVLSSFSFSSCFEKVNINPDGVNDTGCNDILHWDGTMLFNNPDNPFLQEIPDSAVIHPNSQQMIDLIKSRCGNNLSNTYVNTGDYSLPVYLAGDITPRRDVNITLYPPPGKSVLKSVPIPLGARPAAASDGHLAIIDKDSRCVYEFWIYNNYHAGSGNAMSLDSSGCYKDGRSTIAAGWCQLQGVIWPKEMQQGVINHALSFTVPVTNANGYVFPATHNDGALHDNPYAVPEGTLIRIRPDINIDTLPGIGPMEKIIYRAIQRYGMYCSDTNGAGLGIRAVSPASLPPNSYPAAFDMNNEYKNFYMKNFPFKYLEVIYTGELQQFKPNRPYIHHGCAQWN